MNTIQNFLTSQWNPGHKIKKICAVSLEIPLWWFLCQITAIYSSLYTVFLFNIFLQRLFLTYNSVLSFLMNILFFHQNASLPLYWTVFFNLDIHELISTGLIIAFELRAHSLIFIICCENSFCTRYDLKPLTKKKLTGFRLVIFQTKNGWIFTTFRV